MHRNNQIYCGICSFFVFTTIAVVQSQLIPFMTNVGYNSLQQALILASGAIVAIFGQFIFGYLCDRYHQIRRFFSIAYIAYLFTATGMFWFASNWFLYHLFMIGFSSGLLRILMGLNETWMFEIDSDHYGALRACGALGLSVGSLFFGYLLTIISYHELRFFLLGIGVATVFLVHFCKDIQNESKSFDKKGLKKLLKDPSYLLLVFILLLIYMAGSADQYTVVNKLLAVGGDVKDVGWKWGIQSFAEIPIFFLGNWFLQKFRAKQILWFAIFMYALKFFLYAFFQTPLLLVACALLQFVTLPLIMLTSKFLIQEVADENVRNSAQMFAMAIFIGGGSLFAPLLSSFFIDQFGYDTTLYGISTFCLLPLFLCHWIKEDKPRKE